MPRLGVGLQSFAGSLIQAAEKAAEPLTDTRALAQRQQDQRAADDPGCKRTGGRSLFAAGGNKSEITHARTTPHTHAGAALFTSEAGAGFDDEGFSPARTKRWPKCR